MNCLRQICAIFKGFSHYSRSSNLLKKDIESPGKVLEFHLHQRVDTLSNILKQYKVFEEEQAHNVYTLVMFQLSYKLSFIL
jgi:hypothetical protein